MTVLGDPSPPTTRRWSGWATNEGFPIGTWVAQAQVTGDATGGIMVAIINFNVATTPINRNLYSLEQCSTRNSNIVAGERTLRSVNMDEEQTIGAIALVWTFTGPAASGSSPFVGGPPSETTVLKRIFLGAQRFDGIAPTLRLEAPNSNGNGLTLAAQGYFWSPRSLLVEGGPQRPPSGMW